VFVHAKQSPPDRPFDMSQSVLLLLEDASRMFERIDICVLCDVKAKAAWQKFSEDHRRNRRADNVFILTPGDISREEFITAQQRDGEYFGESATKRFIFIDRLIWSRYSVRLDFLHRFLAVQRHYGFYTVLVTSGDSCDGTGSDFTRDIVLSRFVLAQLNVAVFEDISELLENSVNVRHCFGGQTFREVKQRAVESGHRIALNFTTEQSTVTYF